MSKHPESESTPHEHEQPITQVPETIRRIADSEDRKLAWHFFVFFSRIEYALKRSDRFLNTSEGDAQPNWDKFGSHYDRVFQLRSEPELQMAVDYFIAHPPRKQVIANGRLAWSEPLEFNEKGPLLTWLLLSVRRVRNNLFHGGKFPMIPVADPSRDQDLLRNAMIILTAALSLDGTVERFFDEGFANH
jgi:hypothetical protein